MVKLSKDSFISIGCNDAWLLLSSTVRYSLGRMTYMSVLASDLVEKYSKALTNGQLLQIIKEIEGTLDKCSRAGKFCGSPLDHKHWREGVAKLRGVLDAKKQ